MKSNFSDDFAMVCPVDLYELADLLELMDNAMFGESTVLKTDQKIYSAFCQLKSLVDSRFSSCLTGYHSENLGENFVVAFPE